MARSLLPSDISELSLSLGETAELRTLEALRSGLPSAYTVFHSVHWSRDAAYQTTFGEADFIVVNQSGEVVVIEQKSGALDESADGLIKRYPDRRKNVATQVHRTLDGIRDQFKRQSGHDIVLDYLIYCPDYRLRDLNAVGLNVSRIVDSRDASRLADRAFNRNLEFGVMANSSEFISSTRRYFESLIAEGTLKTILTRVAASRGSSSSGMLYD
jgi:hypothetical protein